jgi:hypothetical protein
MSGRSLNSVATLLVSDGDAYAIKVGTALFFRTLA